MTRILSALLLALAAVSTASVQASTVADSHYVAAVVDFAAPVNTRLSGEENILRNIDTYNEFMAKAAAQGVDIILFPEDGLQGFSNNDYPFVVPAPEDQAVPCTDTQVSSKPLRELSCLAARHKMYLVVNLVHEVPCKSSEDPACPSRGTYHYNTDVVFDRSGKIVARYHKYNLFGERGNNVPPTVEYSMFDTDFGVRFGMFICFDILFNKPAAQLVRDHGVSDIVFTAAWFSEVPFLTAVQAHSGWAHALDVTVLASGMNYPVVGSTGSGVYRGRHGILNATFNYQADSTMLVQRVPKKGHWDESEPRDRGLERFDPVNNYGAGADPYDDFSKIRMKQDNMSSYTTQLLPRPNEGQVVSGDERVCNAGFCCQFHYDARGLRLFQTTSAAVSMHGGYSWRREDRTFNKAEAEAHFDGFYYRLMAFNGVRDHSGVATTGTQICGVVSCLSEELDSCGWIAPGLGSPSILWTEFQSIHIEGEYEKEGTLQFASTQAGPRYDPLPASTYKLDSESASKTTQKVRLSLESPLLDLRTLAIYGRYFAWDGNKATGY